MNFLRFLVECIMNKERVEEDKRIEGRREAQMKAIKEALCPTPPSVEVKTRKKPRKRLRSVDILPLIRELDERGALAPLAVAEDID